jgi:hypothetical protein
MIRYRFGAATDGSQTTESESGPVKRDGLESRQPGVQGAHERARASLGDPLVTSDFSFAGHQTFAFRYGWPKKAADLARIDPQGFSREDAMVRLGVGKNMVAAIRHWGLALDLLEEDPAVSNNRGRHLQPSLLGQALCADDGWDPFLEDPATLWLFHWQLASRPDRTTTWWYVFNCYPALDFTRRDLHARLQEWARLHDVPRVSEASLKRDVDCFVLTYSRSRRSQAADEQALDCPLVELGLIREAEDRETYRIVRQQHRSLSLAVFTYALAVYLGRRPHPTSTVALDDLAYGAGSPGRVFCLDEAGLLAHLEQLERLSKGALIYDETSGLKQVLVRNAVDPIALLSTHYSNKSCRGVSWKR